MVGGALAGGCIRRELTVTSDPAGAQLIVNGQAAGNTPVTLAFRHHGTYRVELRKAGYRPVVQGLRVGPKLYEIVPLDFVADVLWPGTIRDQREASFRLEKSPPFDKHRVLGAAARAAADAEKLIPRLYAAPPPRPGARDRRLVPGVKPPDESKDPKKPEKPDPGRPEGKKPDAGPDEPPDVPEIEEGRER